MSDLKDILSSASQWLAILDNLVDEKKGDFISVINHQQKRIDKLEKRLIYVINQSGLEENYQDYDFHDKCLRWTKELENGEN